MIQLTTVAGVTWQWRAMSPVERDLRRAGIGRGPEIELDLRFKPIVHKNDMPTENVKIAQGDHELAYPQTPKYESPAPRSALSGSKSGIPTTGFTFQTRGLAVLLKSM
ncbi:MAG: hypothetical protein M5U25_12755 [Planctomycetota bacterium]|nr:hypothetical protein [Planctomycetota bacterium]